MADDLFEFQAVPKFIDFQNENEDLEKSAFFKGDVPLQATPRVIAKSAPAEALTKPNPPAQQKRDSSVVLQTKDDNVAPGTVSIRASSNLALFNPAASRVAEKVRRRSQQIQAPPEIPPKESRLRSSSIQRNSTRESVRLRSQQVQGPPKISSNEKGLNNQKAAPFTQNLRSYKPLSGNTPIKPLTQANPVPLRRSSSRCRDTKADMDPRIRASIDRLSTPRNRETKVVVKANDEKIVPRTVATRASSNLAFFNPAASRVAEKVRRRSQQIQAPPEIPPKESRLRSSSIQRNSTRESVRLRSQQVQGPPEISSKEKVVNKQKAAPFTHTLRSYKPPTGETPTKSLTTPNPFPFRRSTSRCRDTKPDMDPRIRASVNRLSTPRKRETARQLK